MVRKVVQLTEEQADRLREQSRREGVSMSELVRHYVDLGLAREAGDQELRRRAMDCVGFIHDADVTDLAGNHDRYLAEAWGH